jgi:hypothetical protein
MEQLEAVLEQEANKPETEYDIEDEEDTDNDLRL